MMKNIVICLDLASRYQGYSSVVSIDLQLLSHNKTYWNRLFSILCNAGEDICERRKTVAKVSRTEGHLQWFSTLLTIRVQWFWCIL